MLAMKKALRKALAVLVALSMAMTMSPASAFASNETLGATASGADASALAEDIDSQNPTPIDDPSDWGTQQDVDNYDPSAVESAPLYVAPVVPPDKFDRRNPKLQMSTKLKGLVMDVQVFFKEVTRDVNFKNAQDAIDQTAPWAEGDDHDSRIGPLTAVLEGGSGTYTYEWTMQELVRGADGKMEWVDHTPATFGEENVTDDEEFIFTHSITAADKVEDDHIYKYILTVDDVAKKKTATTEIQVSTYGAYEYQKIYDNDDDTSPISAAGFLYSALLPTPAASLLAAGTVTNTSPAYAAIQDAAANNEDGGQAIAVATQLTITNLVDMGGIEDPPYLFDLEVHLPINATELEWLKDEEHGVGSTCTVYRYDADTGEVEKLMGTVVPQRNNDGEIVYDENGEQLLVVETFISGTSARLGAFAIGYEPVDGFFEISSAAGQGGTIAPAGKYKMAVGSVPTYTVYPQDGYEIGNISVLCNGGRFPLQPNTLIGNVIRLDPRAYLMEDGEDWSVSVSFQKVTPQEDEYSAIVELKGPDGSGNLLFSAGNGDTTYTVEVGQTKPGAGEDAIMIPSSTGLYLEFNATPGYKLGTLTINGTPYNVLASSYYIPTLTSNLNIVAEYVEGIQDPLLTKKVTASIIDENGADMASVYNDQGLTEDASGNKIKTTELTAGFGGAITVRTKPEADYILKAAALKSASATEATDVTSLVKQTQTNDSIQIYNILEDMEVTFAYKEIDANINVNVGEHGSSTCAGNNKLEAGQSIRLAITPDDGYEIGAVTLDGTSITGYLTPRPSAEAPEYWTLKLMKSANPSTTDGNNSDGTTDKVVYVNGKNAQVEITFDPVVEPAPSYLTVTTSIGGLGTGGAVTPTQHVPAGSMASVYFFPEEGYQVSKVTLNGHDVTNNLRNEKSRLDIPNITNDCEVVVTFGAGDSPVSGWTKHTITPSATAGGAISPSEPTYVFEGNEQTFRFFPSTGYKLSKVVITDAEGNETEFTQESDDENFSANAYTFKDVRQDWKILATFARTDSIADNESLFNVNVTAGENGAVSPSGTFQVARGSDHTFVILPDEGYSIDAVNVRTGSEDATANNMLGAVTDGTFTLFDITENMYIDVTFKLGVDPNAPSTDEDNLIRLAARNVKIAAGAYLTPQVPGLVFYREEGTDHATTGANFSVSLIDGYKLDGIDVNYSSVSVREVSPGIYAFEVDKESITQDVFIEVKTSATEIETPEVDTYTITMNYDKDMGQVTPNGVNNIVTVEAGKSQTFTFLPNKGYKLVSVKANNEPITVENYTYTIPSVVANTHFEVEFEVGTAEPPIDYKNGLVTVQYVKSGDGDGKISVNSPLTLLKGGSVSAMFTPASGYETHIYNGRTPSAANEITNQLQGNTLVLSNIQSNTVITYSFTEIQQTQTYQTIKAGSGDHGRISPEGTLTIRTGETQTFTIIPDDGYTVNELWVDGVDVWPSQNGSLTFTTPAVEDYMDVWVSFKRSTDPNDPSADDLTLRTIKATTTAGGTISPGPGTFEAQNGISLNFTFVPMKGYELKKVTVDGKALSASVVTAGQYTLAVRSNHTIDAVFESTGANEEETMFYNVEASAGKGGTISPAGNITVPSGRAAAFTLIPDEGYKPSKVRVTRGTAAAVTTSVSSATYTLFDVKEDTKIEFEFEKLDPDTGETFPMPTLYEVVASASANGSVSPSGTVQVASGAMSMITFIPREGYKLSYAIVDGRNVPASMITGRQYIFSNVTENHTIRGVFCAEDELVADFATINIGNPAGGSISPSGAVLVEKGKPASFTVAPFYGYKLTEFIVNGETVATNKLDGTKYSWDGSKFTFKNVTGDEALSATFEVDTSTQRPIPDYATITVNGGGAGSGGSVSYNPGTAVIEALGSGETIDVSIIPDEGKAIDSIHIDYPDGTSRDYTADEILAIWKKGYITLDRGQVNGGVVITPKFRNQTSKEKYDINNGTLTPASYHQIRSSWVGNGVVNPNGLLKVANGASQRFCMIPDANYELSRLVVDGTDRLSSLNGSRVWTFRGDNNDHTIEATFGLVEATEENHVVKASAEGEGRVSAAETRVPDKGSVTLYFFPNEGYKLSGIQIDGQYQDYSMPEYTITGITADMEVIAFFDELAPGENTWVVNPLTIKASTEGNGSVSPETVIVPEGSAATFNFFPDSGYEVEYVRFNGVLTYIAGGVLEYTAMPIVRPGDADNELVVTYKKIDDNQGDVKVTASVSVNATAGSNNSLGMVSPDQRTVPYGNPATFYIMPAPGYKILSVTVDGKNQPYVGVGDPSTAENFTNGWPINRSTGGAWTRASYDGSSDTGVAGADGEGNSSQGMVASAEQLGLAGAGAVSATAAVYRGDASLSQTAEGDMYYSTYVTTIPSVTGDVTLNVVFGRIDETHFSYVDTDLRSLTVTSTGGGTVSPIGETWLPIDGVENIRLKPYSGYYTEYVMLEEYDNNGNLLSTTDVTDRIVGNNLAVKMGNNDMKLRARFSLIGTPSTVTMGIGSVQGPDGSGGLKDIGVTVDPALVDADGNPVTDFVRGGTYTFEFTPKEDGPNGKPLVIDSIKYNGQDIPFVPGSNYVTFKPMSSGDFEIVFREQKDDEVIVTPVTYTVTPSVVGDGGTIDPDTAQKVLPGGEVTFGFTPEDGWVVNEVYDWYAEKGSTEKTEHLVDPSEYADGTYTLQNVTSDHEITVSFIEVVQVETEWENSEGYVTPNAAPGEALYVDKNSSLVFIVAPVSGYDVETVTFNPKPDEKIDVTDELRQSQDYTDHFVALTGKDVEATDEGDGVAGFPEEPGTGGGTGGSGDSTGGESTGGEEVGLALTDDQFLSQSRPVNDLNSKVKGVGVKGDSFYRAYGYVTNEITAPTNLLTATFTRDPRKPVVKEFTVTAKVSSNGHGRVTPTSAKVEEGGNQTFTFIPDSGYRVSDLIINGVSVGGYSGNSYTMRNIKADTTLEVRFAAMPNVGPDNPGGSNGGSGIGNIWNNITGTTGRTLRTLQRLAQTGDLTMPLVGGLTGVAVVAFGLALFFRRRQKKREQAE